MPEIGVGLEDEEESEFQTNPSVIQGPIGGTPGVRHHWPYDPTPPMSAGDLRRAESEDSFGDPTGGRTAVLGASAGAGLGLAATRALRTQDDMYEREHAREVSENKGHYAQPTAEQDFDRIDEREFNPAQGAFTSKNVPSSPAHLKDEGYMSSAHQAATPEPYQRRARYEDDQYDEFDDLPANEASPTKKQLRHLSGMSHGMDSPLYDAATGKGIDRIESKDIVALMDHLTVRDAQRNARDTEILVTLVRSAAEMRNQFEDLKRFISEQDKMVMSNTDRDADMVVQKVLGGPRPYPATSPRTSRRSGDENEDMPARRRNVFRRALKGLSMRSSSDLTKIEDMLNQLLDEVEGLKDTQIIGRPSMTEKTGSLNSYENLRSAPDPGYEPEGQAGTSSSPAQSGYLSNPSSRQLGMHSGYDGRRGSAHRISTVIEGDEDEQDEYERRMDYQDQQQDRLTTPTQEARRPNSQPANEASHSSQHQAQRSSAEQTPKSDKKGKHKSNSSSLWGIPKISRWSKTTTSTNPETNAPVQDRPYSRDSEASSRRSQDAYGHPGNEPYEYNMNEDDRLRSANSFANAGAAQTRSPSPLIPDSASIEDPKYQAHRNSLNLQHPQPRPGPTARHQTHLDSQAEYYIPTTNSDMSNSNLSIDVEKDQWGSAPSLALNRNRLSTGTGGTADRLSPVYSDGGYSQHSASEQAGAPARPPKVRDDGPLVPEQQQQQQHYTGMYSNQYSLSGNHLATPLEPIEEVRYSLETDNGRRVTSPCFHIHEPT